MLSWALSPTLWHDTGPGLHRAASAQPACPLRGALGSQGTHKQRHFLFPLILPSRSWSWTSNASVYASTCHLLLYSTVTIATKSTYRAVQELNVYHSPLDGETTGTKIEFLLLDVCSSGFWDWGSKFCISFIPCCYFLLEIIGLCLINVVTNR